MSQNRMILVAIAAGVLALPACGGGGSSTNPTPVPTPTPDANLAGNYTLTLTASSVCTTLAQDAKVTTYSASITQTGTSVAVNVVGNVGNVTNTTVGTVSGNNVSLTVSISELRVQSFYGYAMAGTGSGTVAGGNISGTVNGIVEFAGRDFAAVTCNATDHKFAFTKK